MPNAGRRALIGALGMALAAALAGCSAPTSTSAVPPMGRSGPPASPLPRLGSPASDPCDIGTIGGVRDVVDVQLAAFRARDFARAFSLASEQFRAISSVEHLRALIDDGKHAEVLDSASHAFTDCRLLEPGMAIAFVDVTGVNGKTVRIAYQFALEDGRWTIFMSRPMGPNGHPDLSEIPDEPQSSVQPA